MRFKSHLLRRSATAVGAVALSLGGLALIGGPPAGASGGPNPPTTAVKYEVDAYAPIASTGIPVVVTTSNLTTTPASPLYPQGTSFTVSGFVTYTFIGPILAGLKANSISAPTVNVSGFALAPDSNGTATGSGNIPAESSSITITAAGTVAGASWSTTPVAGPIVGVLNPSWTNVCVITAGSGAFNAGDIGDGIVSSPNAFQGLAINDVTSSGTTAILNTCPSATGTGSIDLYGPQSVTQPVSGLGPFTTNAGVPWSLSHTTTSDLELASAGANTISIGLGPISAGPGATGNTSADGAVITGYTGTNQPGPGLSATTPFVASCSALPALPPGAVSTLQSTGCTGSATDEPHDAVSVPLTAAAPTANGLNTSLGVGQTGTVQLTCSPVSPSTTASFALLTTSPQTNNGNTLTFSLNSSTGVLSLNDSGQSGAAAIPIQFTCTDDLALTSAAATVNVSLGTPPVIQPFTEQVNGGTLVLSCSSPATYVTGNNTPTPVGNPLLNCPEFQFQPITLDGLEQQVHTTTGDQSTGTPPASSPGTIYISDNRGSPSDSWTLTGTFVGTATGSIASGGNPNTSCAGVVAFCNSSISTAVNQTTNPGGVHDGWILPSYLQVSGITCKADATGGPSPYNPPNLNPDATPTSGGNFGSPVTLCSASTGQSGGTFLFNATYTLTIPESVYAGDYVGSVQYTVA